MTILQSYRIERKRYLARVRRQQKQGYQVDVIKIPKNPTRASINRLKKQTAKEIKSKSPLLDLESGEVITKTTKIERRLLERSNRQYLTEIRKTTSQQELPSEVNIIIQNFYLTISKFIPPLQEILMDRLNELTQTEEDRIALAKAMKENPDYVPNPADSRESIIEYKFTLLQNIMRMNNEETQEMIEYTDIVESEEL